MPEEAQNIGQVETGADEETSSDEINLQALAEEVLKLLKQEMRIENERNGWPVPVRRR